MSLDEVVSAVAVPAGLALVALEPPNITRLEPQSVTGDPKAALEARIADPLWLLCRQRQFGELEGEDAGTPVSVRVAATTARVESWRPGAAGHQQPFHPPMLLEPAVEAEPPPAGAGPGLRQRAEAGAVALAALDDAGLGGFRDALVAGCPLGGPGPADPRQDPTFAGLLAVVGGNLPDAEALAQAVEAAADGVPAFLAPADDAERDALAATLAGWRRWYRPDVAPDASSSWVPGRLEYAFDVTPGGDGRRTLKAPAFAGGSVDWWSFDAAGDPAAAPGPPEASTSQVALVAAAPLRYAGMPADRLWEFEDAAVSLGAIEAEPYDLARLLLVEYGMAFGVDWLVVPLDVPHGSFTTVDSVVFTTTFEERYRVEPAGDGSWRMFAITATSGGTAVDGLFVPPAAVSVQEGPLLEDVLYLRDEMANMVWAVERTVTGPSGDPHSRADERRPPPDPGPGPVARAELDYRLGTAVPDHWIPYLPTSDGYRAAALVRGRIEGQPPPAGRFVPEDAQRRLADGEVPRDGVRVRRVPVVTRRVDGSYARWVTRRVSVGRGEGSSGLAFDEAKRR
ncbi:MAG TPA: hypothetical protein VL337_06390 [Acidimicrobiales bacterium]|nr:hypothetical protein [Acidimicrobiales bacterium]